MKNQEKEKLKKIARDISDNLIFTSIGVPEEYIATIFMPIYFLEEKHFKEIRDSGMFYEYYSKQNNLSVNGYPTFFSFHALSVEDTKEVLLMLEKLEKAKKDALK